MLIRFCFENYRSFKGEACLDLSATKITEHADRVVETGDTKLLRLAAIYGANASGKSNVFNALRFMSEYVRHSFGFGGESIADMTIRMPSMRYTPFAFADGEEQPSSFEVYFVLPHDAKERTYHYGFVIKNYIIQEEWLTAKARTATPDKAKTIFYRKAGEKIDFGAVPSEYQKNISVSIAEEALILSLGAKLKVPVLSDVWDWFLTMKFMDFNNDNENTIYSDLAAHLLETEGNLSLGIKKYLESFDDSIVEITKKDKQSDGGNLYKGLSNFNAFHRIPGSDKLKSIPLEEESQGTLKMLSMYPAIALALIDGGVLVIDELNTKLHPLLVRNIILTFANPKININNAQLIFTTHDSWQMETKLLRRDEIWFTEKFGTNESTLFSLAEFQNQDGTKIRKDASYEKDYLSGLYGAIPKIRPIKIIKED